VSSLGLLGLGRLPAGPEAGVLLGLHLGAHDLQGAHALRQVRRGLLQPRGDDEPEGVLGVELFVDVRDPLGRVALRAVLEGALRQRLLVLVRDLGRELIPRPQERLVVLLQEELVGREHGLREVRGVEEHARVAGELVKVQHEPCPVV